MIKTGMITIATSTEWPRKESGGPGARAPIPPSLSIRARLVATTRSYSMTA